MENNINIGDDDLSPTETVPLTKISIDDLCTKLNAENKDLKVYKNIVENILMIPGFENVKAAISFNNIKLLVEENYSPLISKIKTAKKRNESLEREVKTLKKKVLSRESSMTNKGLYLDRALGYLQEMRYALKNEGSRLKVELSQLITEIIVEQGEHEEMPEETGILNEKQADKFIELINDRSHIAEKIVSNCLDCGTLLGRETQYEGNQHCLTCEERRNKTRSFAESELLAEIDSLKKNLCLYSKKMVDCADQCIEAKDKIKTQEEEIDHLKELLTHQNQGDVHSATLMFEQALQDKLAEKDKRIECLQNQIKRIQGLLDREKQNYEVANTETSKTAFSRLNILTTSLKDLLNEAGSLNEELQKAICETNDERMLCRKELKNSVVSLVQNKMKEAFKAFLIDE